MCITTGIQPEFQCSQHDSIKLLKTLQYAITPLDKLIVLKKTVHKIRENIERNVKLKYGDSYGQLSSSYSYCSSVSLVIVVLIRCMLCIRIGNSLELATDDIISFIIWIIIQASTASVSSGLSWNHDISRHTPQSMMNTRQSQNKIIHNRHHSRRQSHDNPLPLPIDPVTAAARVKSTSVIPTSPPAVYPPSSLYSTPVSASTSAPDTPTITSSLSPDLPSSIAAPSLDNSIASLSTSSSLDLSPSSEDRYVKVPSNHVSIINNNIPLKPIISSAGLSTKIEKQASIESEVKAGNDKSKGQTLIMSFCHDNACLYHSTLCSLCQEILDFLTDHVGTPQNYQHIYFDIHFAVDYHFVSSSTSELGYCMNHFQVRSLGSLCETMIIGSSVLS